jgi:hypothetical protein
MPSNLLTQPANICDYYGKVGRGFYCAKIDAALGANKLRYAAYDRADGDRFTRTDINAPLDLAL